MEKRNKENKTALVLAGGGIAGAVYELGALRAIDDLMVDLTVNDFDIYVGTSAGAIVASGLVNQLTPQQMLQSIEGVKTAVPSIKRTDLFKFDARAILSRMWQMPRKLSNTAIHYANYPKDFNLVDLLWELSNTLPSALYDGAALEGYTRRLLNHSGIANQFRALEKELYIIATSLETGKRVVFGEPQNQDLTISEAVAASSAMPLLYKPVRIRDDEYLDGGLGGNASIDIAIEHGAKLVVCVNPLVPYDNKSRFWEDKRNFVSDEGMQAVLGQVFRIMLHSGLRYHIKQLRRQYPDVDIILIEPRPDDEKMMFANIMRYSTRLAIAKHGYESVTIDLAEDYNEYKSVLARHGVEIDRDKRVMPQLKRVHEAGGDEDAVEDMLEVTSDKKRPSTLASLRGLLGDLDAILPE